jgi:hypothetical protein
MNERVKRVGIGWKDVGAPPRMGTPVGFDRSTPLGSASGFVFDNHSGGSPEAAASKQTSQCKLILLSCIFVGVVSQHRVKSQ